MWVTLKWQLPVKKDNTTVSLHIVENREGNGQIHIQHTHTIQELEAWLFFYSSSVIASAISHLKNCLKCLLMQS